MCMETEDGLYGIKDAPSAINTPLICCHLFRYVVLFRTLLSAMTISATICLQFIILTTSIFSNIFQLNCASFNDSYRIDVVWIENIFVVLFSFDFVFHSL